MTRQLFTGVLTAAALILNLNQTARGQAGCVPVNTVNGNNLSYQICGVPDLDQRRGTLDPQPIAVPGLPNDGAAYCVPTAIMNWMAYMASHGRPWLKPGPNEWGPAEVYDASFPNYVNMTEDLRSLGELMHTDPFTGTSPDAAGKGLGCWFTNVDFCKQDPSFSISSPDLLVLNLWASGAYSPSFADMTQMALAGALVAPGVGWYETSPNGDHSRDGGHKLTMVMANRSSSNQSMGFFDPANDKDELYTQSVFAPVLSAVKDVFGKFDGYFRVESQMPGYAASAFLDSYIAMRPMFALTAEASIIYILKASVSLPSDARPAESPLSAAGHTVTDIATNPALITHPFLAQGENIVWQINELTREVTRFAVVPSAKRLVFGGRDQQLHVLGDRQIITLDRTGRTLAQVSLAEPADAIAYNAASDVLVAVAAAAGKLTLFTPWLQPRGALTISPIYCRGAVNTQAERGKPAVWIHCSGQDFVTRIDLGRSATGVPAGARQVKLQGSLSPSSFSIGDNGYLYVSDSGVLHVYDQTGRRIQSPFDGQHAGKIVDVGRSFSNVDPATMVGPKYRDVLPENAVR